MTVASMTKVRSVECQKLIKSCSDTFKSISLFLVIFAGTISSQNTRCPFQFFYQFGDGATDIGNSIRILPAWPLLPAARPPYGRTFPGLPTGRWSDGRIVSDYTAAGLGVRNIRPSLLSPPRSDDEGVVFSVDGSTVLHREIFFERGSRFLRYYTLSFQLRYFREYLSSVCSNPTDCIRIRNSTILFGDIQGNDVRYALLQGKSIEEIRTYVPLITQAMIDAGRELIRMGATRVLFSGNAPLGCYPDILTALPSTDPSAYDELGCLRRVNDLIISKNNDLQQAVNRLRTNFRNVTIAYADDYQAVRTVINQTSVIGPSGINEALRTCCGIGGRYNYNRLSFCGSSGVPICPNPNQRIFWDGVC